MQIQLKLNVWEKKKKKVVGQNKIRAKRKDQKRTTENISIKTQ